MPQANRFRVTRLAETRALSMASGGATERIRILRGHCRSNGIEFGDLKYGVFHREKFS
jgi:hypothetical protein